MPEANTGRAINADFTLVQKVSFYTHIFLCPLSGKARSKNDLLQLQSPKENVKQGQDGAWPEKSPKKERLGEPHFACKLEVQPSYINPAILLP